MAYKKRIAPLFSLFPRQEIQENQGKDEERCYLEYDDKRRKELRYTHQLRLRAYLKLRHHSI